MGFYEDWRFGKKEPEEKKMGLFKKEKKQEETKMVRTQEKAYEDDEMEPMDDNDDLEDDEPEPEFKPRGRPPVKMEQLKKAIRAPEPPEPQQDEPKIVEVAVNLELLNNKLNYLITQNNEIINRLKR
jgi:hypothetical protein